MTTEVLVKGSGFRHLVKVTDGDTVLSETETVLGSDHTVFFHGSQTVTISELQGVRASDAPPAPAPTIEHTNTKETDHG